VVHLAAMLGVANTESHRRTTLDVNIQGTKNLVDLSWRMGARLIFVSSSEVYGNAKKVPTSEDCPLSPRGIYAISKVVGEEYTKASALPWIIVRPFNTYGEGQRSDFVIPRFVSQAISGKPLTVYGDGKQTRAFCYVSDLVDALLEVITRPGIERRTFNIGNHRQVIEIRDLAKEIQEMCPECPGVEFVNWAGADRKAEREIMFRCPNTVQAQQVLDWSPQIDLQGGLCRYIRSVRNG